MQRLQLCYSIALALVNAKIKGGQIESLHGIGIHTFGTELYQAPPVYKACIIIILSIQVPRSVSSGGLIYIFNEIIHLRVNYTVGSGIPWPDLGTYVVNIGWQLTFLYSAPTNRNYLVVMWNVHVVL